MTVILRPPQVQLVADTDAAYANGARAVLAQAATGFGKTVVMAYLAQRHTGAHRREFVVDDAGKIPHCRTMTEEKTKSSSERCKKYRAENLEKRRLYAREYMARKRAENPEWIKANNDRYRAKNPEKVNKWCRDRYHRDPLKKREQIARYRAANPGKHEKCVADWGKRNPEKVRATQAKSRARPEAKAKNSAKQMRRHAQKLKATVAWADPVAMQKFYDVARWATDETGIPYEVDHIVPLISPIVCGLHCEANLRVVTANENRSKRNKLIVSLL